MIPYNKPFILLFNCLRDCLIGNRKDIKIVQIIQIGI